MHRLLWSLLSSQGTKSSARRQLHTHAANPSSLPLFQEDLSFITDLTQPASWFPTARALRRRVVAHLGPTNSGKTHSALESLKKAGTGLYCGPLRLLAHEVAGRLNSDGVPCSLVTGQEKEEVPGAQHTACTVEMASVRRVVDVAVVDEIQLMADRSRGHAFTRTLLGLPARTLHVCGDPASLPLLEQLCQAAGDELEVVRYERLLPLRPSRRPLGSLDRVSRGDCLVAFSRREVHALRATVEAATQHRCCVVYGALPPEARTGQAALFNAPRSGYSVLAASDAVGLGLNLNIRRVIFTSLSKFDGVSQRPLTAAEVKQIAGRAGRFGSSFSEGKVTCLHAEDMPALRDALAQPPDPLESAALFPHFEHLSLFASQRPKAGLAELLEQFAKEALLDHRFFFAHYDDMKALAVMMRHLPLSLREQYHFALAPADPDDTPVATALLAWATTYCKRGVVTPALILHPPLAPARSEAELQTLEAAYRVLDLYCWLAYRFGDAFMGGEAAAQRRRQCGELIHDSIRGMGCAPAGRRRRGKAGAAVAAEGEAEAAPTMLDTKLLMPGGHERPKRRTYEAVAACGWEASGGSSSSSSGWSDADADESWQRRRRAYAKRR